MDRVRQKFRGYFEAYQHELLRFVSFKVADRSTAEDITSQVFLRLFEKMVAGEVVAQPRALLYHIARGAVIDEYRRAKRRKTVPLTEHIAEMFVIDSALPEVDTRMEYARILQAVHGLKSQYRDLVLLHYVEELSITEIATVMHETENNIRVRLHRALTKLRKQFSYER